MSYTNLNETADEEMGPGMDLVISLLAFVVLVLAVLAVDYRTELDPETISQTAQSEAALNASITSLQSKLDSVTAARNAEVTKLKAIIASLNEESTSASSAAEAQRAELAAKIEELKGQLNSAARSASWFRRQNSDLNEKIEYLTLRIQTLEISEVELEETKALLNTADTSLNTVSQERDQIAALLKLIKSEAFEFRGIIRDLSAEVEDLKQKLALALFELNTQRNRISVTLNDERNLSIFKSNSDKLSGPGRIEFYKLVVNLARKSRQQKTNVIRVAGHASPESRAGPASYRNLDGNLELSSDRALTIAHELANLGIPMRCIVIEGYGRGRSKVASQRVPPSALLSDYNAEFKRLSRTDRYRDDIFPRERKVDILATSEDQGQCDYVKLRDAIDSAAAEALRALR